MADGLQRPALGDRRPDMTAVRSRIQPGEERMNPILGLVFAVVVVFAVGTTAYARDAKGKVKSWETTTRVITLEDGSQYVVTDKVKTTEKIKVGKHVKMTYEDRDGKNYVDSLEETEAP
jgi:Protein of unknown function (DUF1344)